MTPTTRPSTDDTPIAPGPRMADQADPVTNWFGRNGWVVAAIWLVFLVFPALTILSQDDISTPRKVGSMVLLAFFAITYSHGFRCQELAARFGDDPDRQPARFLFTGWAHLAALIGAASGVYALVDLAAIGLIPFIVSFAAFFLPWPAVLTFFVTGLLLTVLVPLALDALEDVWFMSLIVVGAGGGAMLIRIVETNQAAQAELRTDLVVSDERNRMARDVHDVLGHSLTAVILKAELTARLLDGVEPADPEDRRRIESSRTQLNELESISRSALAEIRSTVGGLRTTELGSEITMARTVLADAGVELLVTGDMTAVPEERRAVLAWVIREAVTNIVRHAKASRCRIELAPDPSRVLLRITDDGIGLAGNSEGNGLRGLRERVAADGAQLHIGRPDHAADGDGNGDDQHAAGESPGSGTRIEVTS